MINKNLKRNLFALLFFVLIICLGLFKSINVYGATPEIFVSYSNTQLTKNPVTVTAYSTSGYCNPSQFTFYRNGSFEFVAIDYATNMYTTKTVTVSWIDADAPNITLTPSTTADTNQDITINTLISDENYNNAKWASGEQTANYFTTAGTVLTSRNSSFTVSENGTYTVYAVDNLGNSSLKTIIINNIDKVAPAIASFSVTPIAPTNSYVFVTINFLSDSVIKQYKIGAGGTWTNYTSQLILSSNDTVYAKGCDSAGNWSSVQQVAVNNIDKTVPTTPTLSINNTAPTNGNVVVTITYPGDATTKQYKVGSAGTWKSYTTPITVTANDTVYARCFDSATNVSADGTLVVSNIDKAVPVITITPYTLTPVNTDITVTATTNEGTLNFTSKTFTANGSFTFTATDSVGNTSSQIVTITNIDKTVPTTPTLSADKTTPTNGDVIVTITYPGDATVKQYKIGNTGTWTTYTTAVTVSANDTIYAKAQDDAGNWSTEGSLDITNIDKIPPAIPVITVDKTTLTNGNVVMTIANIKGASLQYKVGSSGTWTNYSAPVVVTENNTVYARSYDVAGNISEEYSLVISNIDKTAPIITILEYNTNPTNQNIAVYALANEGVVYPMNMVFTENGSFTFTATDMAGNVTEKTVEITNIDKTAPTVSTLSADKTTPTNGNVVVTITYPADVTVKQYKVGSTGTWTAYTTAITVSANNTVYAKGQDSAGNWSTDNILAITNIDKTVPLITIGSYTTTPINTDITVTASTNKGTLNETTHTFTENGSFEFIATDDAGNITKETVTIDNIDNKAPTAPTIITDKDKVTIISGSDSQSGVKNTLYQLNIGEWIAYTGEVILPDGDFVINAKTIDNAGNESVISTHMTVVYTISLADAKTAMDKAESSDIQADLDSAKTLIEALTECTEKTALQNRVADQQIIVTALTSVEAINPNSSSGDITIAIDAVNNLPNGSIQKTQLQADIATVTVNKAVTSKTQTDINFAWSTLLPLTDGTLKTSLDEKLIIVDKALKTASSNVNLAEAYKTTAYFNTAITSVKILAQNSHKDELLSKLKVVETVIVTKVTTTVTKAEVSPSKTNIETALSQVRALDDSIAEKASLLAIVETLRDDYNATLQSSQAIGIATDYVVKSESFLSTYYLDKAQSLVTALPDCSEKVALQVRINKVYFTIAVTNATSAVVKAEKYKTSTYITSAQKLVTALTDSPEKISLQSRLDALK